MGEILHRKGQDYGGTAEANANFREIASDCGIGVFQVWYCYFNKHLRALKSYISGDWAESEPIEGRIYDLCNYLLIFLTLLEDIKGDD